MTEILRTLAGLALRRAAACVRTLDRALLAHGTDALEAYLPTSYEATLIRSWSIEGRQTELRPPDAACSKEPPSERWHLGHSYLPSSIALGAMRFPAGGRS